MLTEDRRTWAEISLRALEENYRFLRSLAPESKFLGLCKANAYGHGLVAIAHALERFGADMLAVATLEEGITLREQGVHCPILCLGDSPPQLTALLLDYGLSQTVHNPLQARLFSEQAASLGRTLPVHIKLDTGLGRMGILCQDTDRAVLQVEKLWKMTGLFPGGLYTHLAQSGETAGQALTQTQLQRYFAVKEGLAQKNLHFPLYHCANSGGVLNHPSSHLDMIRSGIALYGYGAEDGLRPVLQLKSRISALQQLPAGWGVSYGNDHILERDSLVAVLPVGYGDGYSRSFSGQMDVKILGERCPVLGRVCMDMTMVDVTALADRVTLGMVATLYDGELLQEGAQQANTIVYELLCQISSRVPRIYV